MDGVKNDLSVWLAQVWKLWLQLQLVTLDSFHLNGSEISHLHANFLPHLPEQLQPQTKWDVNVRGIEGKHLSPECCIHSASHFLPISLSFPPINQQMAVYSWFCFTRVWFLTFLDAICQLGEKVMRKWISTTSFYYANEPPDYHGPKLPADAKLLALI